MLFRSTQTSPVHSTPLARDEWSRRGGGVEKLEQSLTGTGPVVSVEVNRPAARLAGTSPGAVSRRDRRETETPRIARRLAPGAMRGVCHCQRVIPGRFAGGCCARRGAGVTRGGRTGKVDGGSDEGGRVGGVKRVETDLPTTQWWLLMCCRGVACDAFWPPLYWRFVCPWPSGSSERRACGST